MDISPQNDRNKCQSVENKNIYFNKSLTNLNSKYNWKKYDWKKYDWKKYDWKKTSYQPIYLKSRIRPFTQWISLTSSILE